MRNIKFHIRIVSNFKLCYLNILKQNFFGSSLLLLFIFCSGALAGSATQTDWSGGPGVEGPVLSLGTSFYQDTSVKWSVPGELSAGRADLRYWVDHLVIAPGQAFPLDLDGDGDMDVAGAAFGGADIFVWENMDGSGDSWTRYLVDDGFSHPRGMDWEDVDGDGDPDLLGGSYLDGDLTWWENPGSFGTSWIEHLITDSFFLCQDVDAEDIDGDGDPDLVAVSGYQSRITWWENNDGVFSEHSISSSLTPSSCVATDVNGDGEPDVVVASTSLSQIVWFENLGNGSAWTARILQNSIQPSCLDAYDIDGDGDTDIFFGSSLGNSVGWLENTGDFSEVWPLHTVTDLFLDVYDVAAGDYDSDGDIDIAGSAVFSDNFMWCENTDGYGQSWTNHLLEENYAGYRIYAGDLNSDGRTDIITGGYHTTQICWWDVGSLNGYLESSILDIKGEAEWDSLLWSATEPGGTDVSFQIRASNNLSEMGAWSDTLSAPCSLTGILEQGHQYVQYRALLSASPDGSDPTLEEVSISWNCTAIGESESHLIIDAPLILPISPNPGTFPVIRYIPSSTETIELGVYDVSGRYVAGETCKPGDGVHQLQLRELPSGVYVCRFTSGSYNNSVRFVVID